MPEWIVGDARDLARWVQPGEAEMILTCPPYVDLERYSDDPRDLSTLSWPDFCRSYSEIIYGVARALAPDRFAVFVVGEARDQRTGGQYGLVPYTVQALALAGLAYYTDGVLLTPVYNQARRVSRAWSCGSRKLARCHQHVVVAVKGDPGRAEDLARPLEGGWAEVFAGCGGAS